MSAHPFTITRRAVLALLVAAMAVTVIAIAAPRRSGALPSQFIVYVNTPNGGIGNIWRMDTDGTNGVQLTTLGGDLPAISPDGTKIVFSSSRDGNEEIYVMNADGTGQTRLTSDPAGDSTPAWSPDGTTIAFGSDRTGAWQIFTMASDGTNVVRLTSTSTSEEAPAYSPDGTRIVFCSLRTGVRQIWIMDADGSSPVQVTTDSDDSVYPSWSPDGTLIAFTSQRAGAPNPDTYTITPAGTNESGPLTGQFTQWPEWSPDSTKLVAQSPVIGNWDVYSFNVDGTGFTRLTTAAGLDTTPFWGPGVPGYIPTTTTTSTTTSTTTPAAPVTPTFTG